MELRHLRYFVAIADAGQFVRAALRLHVAQSALSQQIQALERELGAQLLVRDRRGLRLTPAGDVLHHHATRILAAVDDAAADVQRLTGVIAGRLRVGAGAPAHPTLVLEAITRFRTAHPGVEVSVVDAPTAELLASLAAADLDVAVVSRDPAELGPGLEGTLIAREPFVLLVATTHRLGHRGRIRLAQLQNESWITFKPGSGVRAIVDDALVKAGIHHPVTAAATMDPKMLVDLVSTGLGIALTPASFAPLADDGATAIDVTAPRITRPLALAWSRERNRNPALKAFLDIATELLAGRDRPSSP
jgi:DNA-binding transcriptional LysR family regulator